MTALVVVLTVVVAAQLVLLVGLLRSHAEILKQLHAFGAGVDPSATAGSPVTSPSGMPTPQPIATQLGPVAPAEGRRAVDVSGTSPTGDVLGLRTVDVDHDTVLVFLSSTCAGCAPYWRELEDDLGVPDGTRVVVVTREEPDEDAAAIADLAPSGIPVVMSSTVYDDLEVPGSPYVVHVEGRSGRVRGEGTAASWPAVRNLLLRGAASDRSVRAKAAADARRERDADRHLLAAGISPGDPSLYQRADGTVVPVDGAAS
ncbi:MAG: hypothetical protein WEB03_10985 [Nitriliruptor sp.]|uniref:hypothetical protein n=1 Tax=Nitriliruptor sp. TaxID=2448056 RepID=UPI0034A0370C